MLQERAVPLQQNQKAFGKGNQSGHKQRFTPFLSGAGGGLGALQGCRATCRARNMPSPAAVARAAFVSAPSRASEALYHGFGSDNGHFLQIQGCPALTSEVKGEKLQREWP